MNYKSKYEKYNNKYLLLKNNMKGGSKTQSEIPRKIYMFWHDKDKVPYFVKQCIKNIKDKNKKNEVKIYYYNDVMKIKDRPKILDTYRKRGVADWLRLYLLYTYGGIWIDASSVFIKKSLDDIIDLKSNKLLGYTPPNIVDSPKILENWFLASKKKNKFVKMWLNEWIIALQNKEEYCKKYDKYASQKLKSRLPYLTQHLTFLKLISTNKLTKYYKSIGHSEDINNPFYLVKKNNWNKNLFSKELLNSKYIDNNLSFIKITGYFRKDIIKLIKKCKFNKNSYFIKLLDIKCNKNV